jgi:hypothetical protein
VNNGELKKLEDDLWDAANSLRAYGGIKASDYAVLPKISSNLFGNIAKPMDYLKFAAMNNER